MTAITDPKLIAQLEESSKSSKMPDVKNQPDAITDQNLISQLEKSSVPSVPEPAAQSLINQAAQQAQPQPPQQRPMQPQEQFSNPTQMPGFNQLPKNEQLQRINFSQFDPANQSSLGTPVPPGTMESDPARMMASILPTLAQPEIGLGGRFISPILNSMARIGAGTAGNLAYQAPNINNLQQLKEAGKNSLTLNALLEGATVPFRFAGSMAEMFNPLNYAARKANDMRNEYNAATELQRQTYRPVMSQYGQQPVTTTPRAYLGFTRQQVRRFTPDIKKSYSDFLATPNFQNLHNLQSQMGKDYARIATNPNKINTAQTINNARQTTKTKAQQFLSTDQPMLEQYNRGSEITKNLVEPYRSNKSLEKIVQGVKPNVTPAELSNAIRQSREKVLYTERGNPVTAIPHNHPLVNHLNEMNRAINFGKAMQTAVPTILGGIGGEVVHPGIGGLLGGAASGLGGSQLSSLAAKFGAPSISSFVQNPLVQNVMRHLSPLYYGAGRAAIGETQE